MSSTPQRLPPPWLFGITALPYGVYGGYLSTAMPYVLRNAGVPGPSARLAVAPVHTAP